MSGRNAALAVAGVAVIALLVLSALIVVRYQSPPVATLTAIPTALTSTPAVTAPATATPLVTATPTATATPGTAPLPGADRFAIVVDRPCAPPGPAPHVRREDRPERIAELGQAYLCQFHGAVSPDGRRLAYWLFDTGRSELALYENGASRTLVRLQDELLIGGIVWSGDGTGILYVASKGGVQGVAPEYAALRTVDLATRQIRELSRVSRLYLRPLAWDRRARVAAAASSPPSGEGGEYLVIGEDGATRRHALPADVIIGAASPDAAWATGLWRSENVLRYWPIALFEDSKTLRPEPGRGANLGIWRPGAPELVVITAGGNAATSRVDIWSLDGSRRILGEYGGQDGGAFFRPDGSVLFLGTRTAIDVTTGRVTRFELAAQERIAASILVR